MPVRNDVITSTQYADRLCRKCGKHELRRRPRGFFARICSFHSYSCGRCFHREQKFRFTAGTVVTIVLSLAVISLTVFLVTKPPSSHGEETQFNAADALSRARSSSGALTTFEQMMLRKPKSTMDNATILQLWRANVGVNVILQMIRTSVPDYDVSANAVIELKQAGVDQVVILAMIDATYSTR